MRYFIYVATMLLLITSCNYKKGSGNVISQKRDTRAFDGVSAGGAFEVEIKKGNTTEVIVESDDNLLPYIETKVEGGVLKIRTKSNTNFNNGHYKVYITAPSLNFLDGSGAASIKANDVLNSSDQVKVEASGASHIVASIDAPVVKLHASGASSMELTGRTRKYEAEASGSSDIKSGSLQSEDAVISASGASTVHSHASVSINAKANGASSIYYRGAGALRSDVSGAGSVKQEN